MKESNTGSRQLDQEDWALQDHLHARIVRLIDMTDRQQGGTAVKIKIGDRLFLATAAHVIPEGHDVRALARNSGREFVTTFLNRQTDPETDVGFLEISSDDADALQDVFVTEDEMLVAVDRTQRWGAIVIGYPGQLIESKDEIRGNIVQLTHDFRTMAFYSGMITKDRWPQKGFTRPPNAEFDVFVEFDPDDKMEKLHLLELASEPQEIPSDGLDLSGVSGGGIWLDNRPETNSVWHPRPKLIAIQTSMHARDRWLRGSVLDAWLQLVAKHYPDLVQQKKGYS